MLLTTSWLLSLQLAPATVEAFGRDTATIVMRIIQKVMELIGIQSKDLLLHLPMVLRIMYQMWVGPINKGHKLHGQQGEGSRAHREDQR
jgi:hypothetical protein